MKVLREIRQSDIFASAVDKDAADFAHRRAARAIVTNLDGEVALLYVAAYGYHKLPGGGVEDGEDVAQALERELVEEIGCKAEVTAGLGKIVEYRDEWDQVQTSECFLATQVGEMQQPDFTEKERSEGFETVWVDNLGHAISLLQNDSPEDYGGEFIRERDLTFLKAAQIVAKST